MSAMKQIKITEPKKERSAALNGAVAGLVSSMILQPLEVLKVNLILLPNQMKAVKSRGLFSSFKEASLVIYRTEGTAGFFRGLTPAVIRSVTASSLFFYFLEKIKNSVKTKIENRKLVDFFSSATARTLSSVLSNPFTLMKTRAGMVGSDKYSNVWRNFKLIYKGEGLGGFFKGSMAMVARDFPFGGVFYLTYNASNKFLLKYSENPFVYLTSGMVAGITATVMTQPLEIVKSKLYANTERVGKNNRLSIVGILKDVYRTEGFRGYMRGLLPMMLRKPLINAATFFFYEVMNESKETEKEMK